MPHPGGCSCKRVRFRVLSRPMSAQLHRQILGISLALYIIATWTSMAGMEIFGWLTFLISVTYMARGATDEPLRFKDFNPAMPWKGCFLLLAITAIGLAVNGTAKTEYVQDFGSMRWMFLFFSSSFALAVKPPTLKGYRLFLICTSIIAIYAIFQSFTGIDLVRPGQHRAVQPLDDTLNHPLWRSAGLFGSPLAYAYIVGQHVCLPLAMLLLTFENRKKYGWLFWGSLAAYILICLSLITTFTRGVWIAMAVAHLFVALLVSRKVFAGILVAGAALMTALYAFVPIFQYRIGTLFHAGYQSNSDRVFIWKYNWEMFKDYPIFGIGYQENENRAGEYVTRMGHPDAFTGHAHNNVIQMLSGTGVTGLLAWLFIVGFMIWLNWRLWRNLPKELLWPRAIALGCLGAQITLHIGGMTECNFKAGATSHNLMLVWALVASMMVLLKKYPERLKAIPNF